MTFALPGFDLAAFVASTLAEDLGGPPGAGGKDVTSESVIPADVRFTGVMPRPSSARLTRIWKLNFLWRRATLCRVGLT
jgi:hypothetical protein